MRVFLVWSWILLGCSTTHPAMDAGSLEDAGMPLEDVLMLDEDASTRDTGTDAGEPSELDGGLGEESDAGLDSRRSARELLCSNGHRKLRFRVKEAGADFTCSAFVEYSGYLPVGELVLSQHGTIPCERLQLSEWGVRCSGGYQNSVWPQRYASYSRVEGVYNVFSIEGGYDCPRRPQCGDQDQVGYKCDLFVSTNDQTVKAVCEPKNGYPVEDIAVLEFAGFVEE